MIATTIMISTNMKPNSREILFILALPFCLRGVNWQSAIIRLADPGSGRNNVASLSGRWAAGANPKACVGRRRATRRSMLSKARHRGSSHKKGLFFLSFSLAPHGR